MGGEWAQVRSILRPVAPMERADETQPGSSANLLAVREMARPKAVKDRNAYLKQENRCIHIGRPGDIATKSADRVIYAASQVPSATLVATAMSPPYRSLQEASRSKCRKKQNSKRGMQQRKMMTEFLIGSMQRKCHAQ